MKSKIILLTLAGGTALLFAADSPKKQPDNIGQLQAKIAALEERVTALEARMTVRTEFIAAPSELTAPMQPSLNYLEEPPNIGSIDVNGLKFFWVPIGSKVITDH